jgi:NADPH2 dehydrogenase
MAVGLIVGPEHAEEIVASGKADMVALARGMMDNPRWAWHAAQALDVEIDYPEQYIRCAPKTWPGAAYKNAAMAAE